MLPYRLRCVALALVVAARATAEPRPAAEQIGSWVLSCPVEPATASCELRYQNAVLSAAGSFPIVSLEVLKRQEQFVPVIAVRRISLQMVLTGALAVQANIRLRFDSGQPTALACALDGADVMCAPEGSAVAMAAEQLVTAHSVLVQIQLGVPKMAALPEQSRALDLQRTAEAVARFRATEPAGETMPIIGGLDWRGFLDRLARDAGFEQGLADVIPRTAAMIGGPRGGQWPDKKN